MPSSEPSAELVRSSSTGIMEAADSFIVNLLLIAIGGALGSVARYLLSTFVLRATGTLFPLGTFVVNVIGCWCSVPLRALRSQRVQLAPELRLFLLTGILGGFTTFSSYAFESFTLRTRRAVRSPASVNIVGQVVVGTRGIWAGYVIDQLKASCCGSSSAKPIIGRASRSTRRSCSKRVSGAWPERR